MNTGYITGYFDVAQLTLYAFWLFFAGLIYYLRQEDKREGYPLVTDRNERIIVQGWPPLPTPKTYQLEGGLQRVVPGPDAKPQRPVAAEPNAPFPGSPLDPTGDPLADGVGPASWADRKDVPDMLFDAVTIKIVPLRVATDYYLEEVENDPRGKNLVDDEGAVAGKVVDIWVDRAELTVRYLEVEVAGGKHILAPVNFLLLKDDHVLSTVLTAEQIARAPTLAKPDVVTLLEEDKAVGWFGGGTLYTRPGQTEPFL